MLLLGPHPGWLPAAAAAASGKAAKLAHGVLPADRGDLLLYNRVPKSGSSTVQDYIDKLSKRLGYKAVHYVRPPGAVYYYVNHTRFVNRNVTSNRVRTLARHFARLPRQAGRAVCVDYHFPYINFTALGMRQPLYINTLRDPVERIISAHYYGRYGPRDGERRRFWLHHFGSLSLEQCVDLYQACNCTGTCSDPVARACTGNQCADTFAQHNEQMMFFCSWGSPECAARDRVALEHAKRVLASSYVAFGILERHDETLELLDAVLPRYFRGSAAAAQRRLDKRGKAMTSRSNKKKEVVSEAAKAFLRKLNALDVEFYEFATQLFDQRHKQAVGARPVVVAATAAARL